MWWYVVVLLMVSILGVLMGSRREGFEEEAGDLTLAIKSAEEAAKKATEAAGYMKKVGETLKKEAEENT